MKTYSNRNAETLRQIFSDIDKVDDSVSPTPPIHPTPSKLPKKEDENNNDRKKDDKPEKSFTDYLEDELNKNRANSSWVIDRHGNRITDEDARERVRRNRSEIDFLKKRMEGRSKADNFRDGSRLHDLNAENDYYEQYGITSVKENDMKINSSRIPKLQGNRDYKFDDAETEIKRQIHDKFEDSQYFKIESSRDGFATGYVEVFYLNNKIMSFGIPDNSGINFASYSFKLTDDSLTDFYWKGITFNDFKIDLNDALDILAQKINIHRVNSSKQIKSSKENDMKSKTQEVFDKAILKAAELVKFLNEDTEWFDTNDESDPNTQKVNQMNEDIAQYKMQLQDLPMDFDYGNLKDYLKNIIGSDYFSDKRCWDYLYDTVYEISNDIDWFGKSSTPVKSALDKNKQFTLTQSEREALEVMLSFVTGAYGDDEEVAKFKVVRDSLTPEEIEQIDDLCMYVLADDQNYKTISSRQIKDDMELLNKVYNLLDNNNLLDEEWDAMNAFEKIALE